MQNVSMQIFNTNVTMCQGLSQGLTVEGVRLHQLICLPPLPGAAHVRGSSAPCRAETVSGGAAGQLWSCYRARAAQESCRHHCGFPVHTASQREKCKERSLMEIFPNITTDGLWWDLDWDSPDDNCEGTWITLNYENVKRVSHVEVSNVSCL